MILLRIRRFCTKCSMVGRAPSTYWVTIASFFQSGLQPASCLLGAVLLWVGGAGVHPAVAEVSAVRMVEPVGEGATDQWPQWRGPSRRSVVAAEGYPDRWSDTHNVLWRVEVPGRGHSSPILWDDRIFLTTAYDQFVEEPVEEILGQQGDRVFLDERDRVRSVLCFRRSDGELLWETFVPYRTAPEQGWPKSSYASSTPATDGQRVYAYFELLHVNQLESHVFASPALLDKRWYIRTYKHLMCIGER